MRHCQTHLEVKAFVGVQSADHAVLAAASDDALRDTATYEVEIRTRDGVLTEPEPQSRRQVARRVDARPEALRSGAMAVPAPRENSPPILPKPVASPKSVVTRAIAPGTLILAGI